MDEIILSLAFNAKRGNATTPWLVRLSGSTTVLPWEALRATAATARLTGRIGDSLMRRAYQGQPAGDSSTPWQNGAFSRAQDRNVLDRDSLSRFGLPGTLNALNRGGLAALLRWRWYTSNLDLPTGAAVEGRTCDLIQPVNPQSARLRSGSRDRPSWPAGALTATRQSFFSCPDPQGLTEGGSR